MATNPVKYETLYPFAYAIEEIRNRIEMNLEEEYADLPIIRIGGTG